MKKELIANYIKEYQETGAGVVWGLNLALRHCGINYFKKTGIKNVDFPSIIITNKNLKSIKVIYECYNEVIFEMRGLVYDSENNEVLFANKKMVFRFFLSDDLYDGYRTCFLGFNSKKNEFKVNSSYPSPRLTLGRESER